ncbi:MAG: sigma-70 family RNA polymerase sigma factor [bacterium]|nr:sigma-70 family RNA polymerase sigma factor [bacterium]
MDERETRALDQSLRRLAVALVGHENTADDLVQEAWLASIGSARPRVRDRAAWMRRVVRNLASRHRARAARRRELEAFAVQRAAVEEEDFGFELDSMNALLRTTLAGLREPYRSVLHMRFLEDRPIESIATALGRSRETVKSQVRRGTIELRAALDRAAGGDRSSWARALVLLLPPRRRTATFVARALLVVGCVVGCVVAPIAVWKSGLLGTHAESLAAQSSGAAPSVSGLDTSSATLNGARRSASPAPRANVPITPAAPNPDAVTERKEAAVRRLDVELEMPDGEPYRGGTVEVIGLSALGRAPLTIGHFELDVDGRAAIEIPEHVLLGAPEVPGPIGGVRVAARATDGAWSHLYAVPLPRAGRSLTIPVAGRGQTLRGTVLDPFQAPVEGALVKLRRERDGVVITTDGIVHHERTLEATTDAAGAFEIEGAPRRLHHLQAFAVGWQPARRAIESADDVVQIELELAAGARVTGVVHHADGSPASNVRVWEVMLGTGPRDRLPHARTDALGRYELTGLAPGRHRIFATDPSQPSRFAATVLEADLERESVWDAVLEAVQPLRLHVVEADGEPVPAAKVIVVASDVGTVPWGLLDRTDASGHVTFPHVPDETLGVAVRRDTDMSNNVTLSDVRPAAEAIRVQLEPSSLPSGVVQGVLLDHRGQPFEDALVIGCSTEDYFQVNADPITGAFRAEGKKPARYEVWAAVQEHGMVLLGVSELAADSVLDFDTVLAPERVPVRFDWEGVSEDAKFYIEVPGPCDMGPKSVLSLDPSVAQRALLPGEYEVRALNGTERRAFALTGPGTTVQLVR